MDKLITDPNHFDTLNSLNFLLKSLADEINESNLFCANIDTLNSKTLMKFLNINMVKNDFNVNEYDLSYEEKILLQLNVIKTICENDFERKDNIVVVDIPILTRSMLTVIETINNCRVIISTSLPNQPLTNYLVVEGEILDLASDDNVYTLICDNNISPFSLKEAYKIMEKYVNEEKLPNHDQLFRLLKIEK